MSDILSLENCILCPRKCGVNRTAGIKGYCGQGGALTAARAYLHMWEEPCISGTAGSGTVFFSGCNMRCVFCQNSEIASGDVSKEISTDRLAEIFLELQDKKASNINLVTPTHFVPLIIPAIKKAKSEGLSIPIVYNTSAYENVETIKALDGLIDIYLPDCKYYSDEPAIKYSHAPSYFKVSMAAISEMLKQVGEPVFYLPSEHSSKNPEKDAGAGNQKDSFEPCSTELFGASTYNNLMENSEDDYCGPLMKSGVIVRHLMLPGQLEDSMNVVRELLSTFSDKVYLSIMNQFTPHGDLTGFPELLSGINDDDYDKLIDYCIDLGIENGFFQGSGTDSESFIPAFDFYGL